MLIHRELLRTNLFLQSRGIGALQKTEFMLEKIEISLKNPKA